MNYPDAVRRAGHADGDALFQAILDGRSGITFTVDDYEDVWSYVSHPDHRIELEIPELIDELNGLRSERPGWTSHEFPLVLSAGERRANTANTIIRDPAWHKRDRDGALRVSPQDAQSLGRSSGARAMITTAAGSAEATVEVTDMMLPGHVSLPNGQGLNYPGDDGVPVLTGVPANELTSPRLARSARRRALAQACSCSGGGGRRLRRIRSPPRRSEAAALGPGRPEPAELRDRRREDHCRQGRHARRLPKATARRKTLVMARLRNGAHRSREPLGESAPGSAGADPGHDVTVVSRCARGQAAASGSPEWRPYERRCCVARPQRGRRRVHGGSRPARPREGSAAPARAGGPRPRASRGSAPGARCRPPTRRSEIT